jgi:hypothetical protein
MALPALTLLSARPWVMCRDCHRKGCTRLKTCRKATGLAVCGQCGQARLCYTCHDIDFRPHRPQLRMLLAPDPDPGAADDPFEPV